MSDLLSASGMAIHRGDKALLSGCEFGLKAGEIIVVLGPNGAGKSSLLLALAGLLPATGSIGVAGKALASYPKDKLMQHIAWQGDLPPTEFGLTVLQRLSLVLSEATQSLEDVAQYMDMTSLLTRPLQALSSGERQRVELAALLLRDAPVWLLDEPTSHLDIKHQVQAIQMLKEQAAHGRAIMLVLHDIQQATAVASHLILLDGKGGMQYGSRQDLLQQHTIAQLFDAPLVQYGELLMPNYGGNDESTR